MRQAVTTVINNAVGKSAGTGFGFDDDVSVLAAYLRPGTEATFLRTFDADRTYALIGGGDGDAVDVDIYISDEAGNVIAADRDDDASPLVNFKPPATGRYRMTLRLERASQDSFCALVTLRTGGYNVPVANLASAVDKLIGGGAMIHARAGDATFHFENNKWSLFGTVLAPKTNVRLRNIRLERRTHVLFGVADGNGKDLDLRLEEPGGEKVAEDKGDGDPLVVLRTADVNYQAVLENQDSNGPTLSMLAILDVRGDDEHAAAPAPAEAEWRPGRFMKAAVARVVGGAIDVMSKGPYGLVEGTSLVGAFLQPGRKVGMRLPLLAKKSYVLVGGGGEHAGDVDIVVYDPDGKPIASDRKVDASPVVEFTASRAGLYEVELRLEKADGATFCAFAALVRDGGFRVPVSVIGGALAAAIELGARVDRRVGGAHFHDAANNNALFGMVVPPATAIEISGLQLEARQHAVIAVSDDESVNVDLALLDAAGAVVARDDEPASRAAVAAATDGGTYRIQVRNRERAGGARLIVSAILDVEK
jgi:hypothetical protein